MNKKNTKTYYYTIEISVFKTAVLVIVANNRKDILWDLPTIYADFKITKEALAEDIKMIESVWNSDEDPDFMPIGETIRLGNSSGDVLMFFNADNISKISEELIVHETHHASTYICDFRGIKDEECEAYVQEYLFNQMMCKIIEYNNKHKKKKS